jgi:hypothetical protein
MLVDIEADIAKLDKIILSTHRRDLVSTNSPPSLASVQSWLLASQPVFPTRVCFGATESLRHG